MEFLHYARNQQQLEFARLYRSCFNSQKLRANYIFLTFSLLWIPRKDDDELTLLKLTGLLTRNLKHTQVWFLFNKLKLSYQR
ncbi:hypothetical protein CDAR_260511 [Caerostris darwini]|uniref:Uncharacterized protein n=1 Tax=Caerostris darwini TaxID=1538125 RepID=A0AAV4NQH5_9ARAC|nr:hypothetical protein CDAR_260511 [Caerostris darwini]